MKKFVFIVSILCFFIDQISKLFILHFFSNSVTNVIIPNFFSIIYVENTGAAWGMFSNGTLILALLSLIFLFIAIKYVVDKDDLSWFNVISYGFIIGGVLGNLFDRIVRSFVVDFLSFKFFSYSFPVFNIADCFIVVGIILVLIDSFLESKRVKK